MDYDFNTPGAIAAVFDLVTAINSHVVAQAEMTSGPSSRQKVAEAYGLLIQCLGILGLTPKTSEELKPHGDDLSQELLEIFVEMRNSARREKDFKTADYIRDRLSYLGFALEDTPSGTKIRHQK